MDMQIFQVNPDQVPPRKGGLLIASPFLSDYHFSRSVIHIIDHGAEGTMGVVINKDFRYKIYLSDLVPELKQIAPIPVFKGGPVSRETLFYIHRIAMLPGSLDLGNGLYLNGDFDEVKKYLLDLNPTEGVIRFFAGYAGWDAHQLHQEIKGNSWIVSQSDLETTLQTPYKRIWHDSLARMGGKYALWATYPLHPTLN